MFRYSFLIFLSVILTTAAQCQERIGSFPSYDASVEDFSSSVHGDSLFVNILFNSAQPGENVLQYWIDKKNGTATAVLHEDLVGKALCGITSDHDTINYYFYSEVKKQLILNVLRSHTKSGFKEVLSTTLRTDLKFLGSYVDKNLMLIFSSPETFSIRLIEMKKLVSVSEKKFQVPNDLFLGKEKFLFVDEGARPRMHQTQALKKIYKLGSELIITADEPYEDYNEKRKTYKTTLVRLDLNKLTTTIKFFVEERKIPFSTVVFNEHLYRMFEWNIVDVFSLKTGSKIQSGEFHPRDFFEGSPQYVRDGKKGTISKRLDGDKLFLSKSTAFMNADTLDNKMVLTIGRSGQRGGVFLFNGGLIGMVASIAVTAIKSTMEPKNLIAYSYVSGSALEPFRYNDKIKGVDQRIDEFEVARYTAVKFILKAYMENANAVYGFYQRQETKSIEIVRFNK